ncbi:MAG: hypothetical protein JWQ09_999 [Segetibacter sp.]|nr:hypothetical protein [Segetibacter sp.]
MQNPKEIFVIMPFSATNSCTEERWTEIFFNVFKPAIEALGYTCERAMPETGSLTKSIVEKLRHSRIVLADVTDRNANVFYELGVRHSLSKRTIIITQDSSHVPSDLKGYWFIQYGILPGQVSRFKEDIRTVIIKIEGNPEKSDNPISDYLEKEYANVSTYIDNQNLKKLSALYTEFSGNIISLNNIIHNSDPKVFISLDCLKILLQTQYIDLGTEMLKSLYELLNKLRLIETGDYGKTFVTDTVKDLRVIASKVLEIRNKLANNDYNEPTSVSLMVWEEPLSPNINKNIFLLGCENILTEKEESIEKINNSNNSALRERVCLLCNAKFVLDEFNETSTCPQCNFKSNT